LEKSAFPSFFLPLQEKIHPIPKSFRKKSNAPAGCLKSKASKASLKNVHPLDILRFCATILREY
jgi:hypothetical protein